MYLIFLTDQSTIGKYLKSMCVVKIEIIYYFYGQKK